MQKNNFIESLFRFLKAEKYVLLKWLGKDISHLPEDSDLDILVTEEVAKKIGRFIEQTKEINKVKKEERSGVTHFYLYFEKGDFLQIDLLFKFVRKELIYLPNEIIFKNNIKINNIKTCTRSLVFEHVLLFNFLNYSGLPDKYFTYFNSLSANKQEELISHFNQKYGTNFKNIVDTTSFTTANRATIINYLGQLEENSFANKVRNGVNHLKSVGKSLKESNGQIITFSGVDGAGKSTIIKDVLHLLGGKYRKNVVVLRHRPSLLPIISAWRYGKKKAEEKSVARLPRQGNNKNNLSSLFRFGYYYLDYLLGQFYVWAKYLLRGYIVLYDRYYFDFIVDGKRSNISLNESLPKNLYPFIAKPKLNFFLYADADTILKRKKELAPETIKSLTRKYRSLFKELSTQRKEVYLDIENIDRKTTLHTILEHYIKIA